MELDKEKLSIKIREKLGVNYIKSGRMVSLDEASREIWISKATLSRICNGMTPDVETLIKICAWLNESLDSFVKK